MKKLIRDNVPAFIKAVGKEPKYHVEEDSEKKYKYLLNKLVEEAKEVKGSTSEEDFIHEMADVYEVFTTLLRFKGYSLNDAQDTAKAIRAVKGSFDKFIVLDKVD